MPDVTEDVPDEEFSLDLYDEMKDRYTDSEEKTKSSGPDGEEKEEEQ